MLKNTWKRKIIEDWMAIDYTLQFVLLYIAGPAAYRARLTDTAHQKPFISIPMPPFETAKKGASLHRSFG